MVQEEQIQMCSNSSSGGCGGIGSKTTSSSSKKLKQKKVPQRGLGVAQLEKIRIEEQQKKDLPNTTTNFSSSNSTTLSPTNSSSVLPTPSFPSYPQPKPSILPFHPPQSPPPNHPSSNHMFRARPTSNFDNFPLGPMVPPINAYNGGVFNIGWPMIPTNGNGGSHVNVSVPMLWHPYELNLEHKGGENSRLDNHHGLSFMSNSGLPYESCPIGPLPDVMPRVAQHYQQPSSLTNVSSMSSSSSSTSVLTFPMEPPSTQSYYNNYSPLWPDEEKMMIGMMRPCPFPFDSPPIPTFKGKFTHVSSHPISQTDESTTCTNGGITFNFEPAIPVFREVPSCQSVMVEPTNTKKMINRGSSNGEFLTLAPPAIASHFPNLRLKQSSTILASQSRDFCYNFESLPCQASIEDLISDSGQVGSNQQPKFLSLFPTTKEQAVSMSPSTRQHNCNGDLGETIDLNLRL